MPKTYKIVVARVAHRSTVAYSRQDFRIGTKKFQTTDLAVVTHLADNLQRAADTMDWALYRMRFTVEVIE